MSWCGRRILAVCAALWILAAAGCGKPTPSGYWEGSGTFSETPMKDHARTLTRSAKVDFWFVLDWKPAENYGVAVGEADAVYDAVLTVENLPQVTAPVPGGNVKFEPKVGGKLTDTDRKRRFPIVGVFTMDPNTGQGSLLLQKANQPDDRSESERLDDEAAGRQGPDAPMEFTIRADPGVSGGFSGAAGSINYEDGRISGGTGGVETGVDVGSPGGVIVQKIPMTPFSPFSDTAGKVEKRSGGPFVASFEEEGESRSIKWKVQQMGGEQREPPRITPEMEAQVEELMDTLGVGG